MALAASVLLIMGGGGLTATQETTKHPPVHVLDLPEAEVKRLIQEALDRGLSESSVDNLAVLAKNRSSLVIPELLSRLEVALQDPAVPEKFIHTVADIIAFAADEVALDALMRLAVLDHKRFGYFIGRAFDYAQGRRNPYLLAYYAIGKASPQIDQDIIKWVQANAPQGHGFRDWAEAIAEREEESVSEKVLDKDPIISRLPGGIPVGLLEELKKHPRWIR
jgi:hypothetical protein